MLVSGVRVPEAIAALHSIIYLQDDGLYKAANIPAMYILLLHFSYLYFILSSF